ncbi:MAG: hypothetical protein KGM97_03700 [Alphaproteobacteria bacterium]|nr:hypothetical protein [Alphaproteobacteria bacterium]MDE2630075.1 hypothetical protein [Alphaproteobacteria bacterium]
MSKEIRVVLSLAAVGAIAMAIAAILWPYAFPTGASANAAIGKLGFATFLVVMISFFFWAGAVLCLSVIVFDRLNGHFNLKRKMASAAKRINRAKLAVLLSTAASVVIALAWTWMTVTGSFAGRGQGLSGLELGTMLLSLITLVGWLFSIGLLLTEFTKGDPAPAAGRRQSVYRAIDRLGNSEGVMILAIFAGFGWLVISVSFMMLGDWRAFLAMGIPFLLAILLRAFPYWAEPPRWLNRLLDASVLGGVVLVSYALVRFDDEKTFEDHINTYLLANDFASAVREAKLASWGVDHDRAYDALTLAIARKAKMAFSNCGSIGDRPVQRAGQTLAWDLNSNVPHEAQYLLDNRDYENKPTTVFLVGVKQQEQVGVYSISKEPAFREWVNVCVVQFDDLAARGTAVSSHTVISLDPATQREVRNTPEYGAVGPPVANWIKSLAAR